MERASPLDLDKPADENRIAAGRVALAAGLVDADAALVERALEWIEAQAAERTLKSGESLVAHVIATASILREFRVDAECLAASMLAHFVQSGAVVSKVRDRFGARVAELAEGVARMAMIEGLSASAAGAGAQAAQHEGLRKMLLAMAQDMRVVLVKLADHTQTMRFAVRCEDPQMRKEAARLALDIFAPLANRLGIWQLKWELEDLALRILEPQTYQHIAALLDEKRASREQYIETAIALLRNELARAGIKAEISGRPKHIYSIYNKMRSKEVDFDELYDVRAVRVLVESVSDCYAVLSIVHNAWTPLQEEFDDYIAKPKNNDYRSLHTAVVGPAGKAFEIQIRTFEMHQHAELGVAAHWRYKEGITHNARRDANYDAKIAWLRQIVAWQNEVAVAGATESSFGAGLFADTIYVLTPQGRVIDLPRDATPIDFAYHVHTDLGHRCRGARVNGAMVPLNTPLANGQQVEIVTNRQGGPSRDWMNPALGYTKSAGARAKIRQWFNRQNHEASVAHGREILDKELQRGGRTAVNLDELAHRFKFEKLDEFLVEVGRGEIGSGAIQIALHSNDTPPEPQDEQPILKKPRAPGGGILIVGVDKLLTVTAKCCKPAPPDGIIGFVSRGRGVTIHRRNCENVARLATERLVDAAWGASHDAIFPVDIVIEANDRTGLLRDITEILSRERINVTATNTASRNAQARMQLTVEINHLNDLQRVLALIRDVPGVASAARR